MKNKLTTIGLLLAFITSPVSAQIAAGGAFALEKSVVAAGGGASSSGAFSATGTAGQPAAGTTSSSAIFSQKSGFWTPDQFAPTAAMATIGGRVTTAGGRGIRNASVTITGADGVSRSVSTGSLGYFSFTDCAAGSTFTVSVAARRFTFAAPTQILMVVESVSDLSFVASEEP